MNFEMHLEDNLFDLYGRLMNGTYKHLPYTYFQVFDNKKRDIYKAEVMDRVVHQIIYDHLLAIFDPDFIADSYGLKRKVLDDFDAENANIDAWSDYLP